MRSSVTLEGFRYPISLLGLRAGGAEKRQISQERTMSLFYGTWKQLHHLDAVGLWESGSGPICGPSGVILKLCVCAFPQEMFPSYTAQVKHHFTLLWLSNVPLCVYIYHIFIHSSVIWVISMSFYCK